MPASPFDALSDRERECLRLYSAGFQAKEIAPRLGISHHTVNEHFRNCRRVLSVGRTIEAARMLAAFEDNKCLVPDPIGIDPPLPPVETGQAILPAHEAAIARNRYELGFLPRLGVILAIAFIAVALAGALIVGAEAITRLFWDYRIDISDPQYQS